MSKAKFHDTALVQSMLREAVLWFHESRLHEANKDRDIWSVARECANGAFQKRALLIPSTRREIVARKFMAECQSTFGVEVPKALAETKTEELSH